MSQNVKKSSNKGKKPSQTKSTQSAAQRNTTTAKKSGTLGEKNGAGKKPPLQSTNMNARRSERSKAALGELEERGYVKTRSTGKADPNAQAKKDDIIIIVVTLVCILMVLSYVGICGIVGTGINAFVFGLY